MKLQFLGDSKDCFKWDYHDFLTREMGYEILNVAFMMTPDEKNSHGRTEAANFPAGRKIVNFCQLLRTTKDPRHVGDLPKIASSQYVVKFHKPQTYFTHPTRYQYFSDVSHSKKQVVFLDPDNGFEPERTVSEKHLAYPDVFRILDQTQTDTIISVFHHFRRIQFHENYKRIQERLNGLPSTAIHWKNFLMFVGISKSEEVVYKIKEADFLYSQNYERVSVL